MKYIKVGGIIPASAVSLGCMRIKDADNKPEEIIETAGQGRTDAAAHIGQAVAVFIILEVHVLQPFPAEQGDVRPAAVLLDAVQIDQLQVKIIVFDGLDKFLRISLDVHQLHTPLQRAAQSASDVLTHPAGVNLVKKQFFIHIVFSCEIYMPGIPVSCQKNVDIIRRLSTFFH